MLIAVLPPVCDASWLQSAAPGDFIWTCVCLKLNCGIDLSLATYLLAYVLDRGSFCNRRGETASLSRVTTRFHNPEARGRGWMFGMFFLMGDRVWSKSRSIAL